MAEELKTTEEELKEMVKLGGETIEQLDGELKALKDAISGKDSMIAELKKQIALVEEQIEDTLEENIKIKESLTTAVKPVLKAWMDINMKD